MFLIKSMERPIVNDVFFYLLLFCFLFEHGIVNLTTRTFAQGEVHGRNSITAVVRTAKSYYFLTIIAIVRF